MSPEPMPELDDLEVPDYPGDDIDLEERLDWHLSRVAWYRRKVGRAETQRDRMVARYHEWCEKTTEGWRRKIAESEAAAGYILLSAIDSDPKHPKTLHLPSGTIRSVAGRPSVVVDDPDEFRKWVTGRDDEAVLARWRCEPNKSELAKVLADGEVVAGCHLEQGERKVSISLEEMEA